MKRITYLLPLIMILACNTTTKKETSISGENENMVVQEVKEDKPESKKVSNSTYLCKINGEDWAYTKASGIVSTHRKTKKRTALLTFKKKLKKGSESIQLHYDTDSKALVVASLQLKFKNKDGKLFTCYYTLNPDNKSRKPQSTLSGTIDLSNTAAASGTAEITNITIDFEKKNLLNPENSTVTLTDLKFTGIGYSDIDKLSNAFKK